MWNSETLPFLTVRRPWTICSRFPITGAPRAPNLRMVPQHRRRCGLDENGCRLVNGEAAQMEMAWRLLDLKPSKWVESHIFWGWWFQIQASLGTLGTYVQLFNRILFFFLGGWSQLSIGDSTNSFLHGPTIELFCKTMCSNPQASFLPNPQKFQHASLPLASSIDTTSQTVKTC